MEVMKIKDIRYNIYLFSDTPWQFSKEWKIRSSGNNFVCADQEDKMPIQLDRFTIFAIYNRQRYFQIVLLKN